MGATLPAIARWVETTPTGVSWLGFFYGSNIAGAVFGCLLAGLLSAARPRHGDDDGRRRGRSTSPWPASGLALSKRAPHRPAVISAMTADARRCTVRTHRGRLRRDRACPASSALGAEVVWTRLLSLMLGASVYTFSIILAVFLIGLGFGSSAGAFLARGTRPRARSAGASCC